MFKAQNDNISSHAIVTSTACTLQKLCKCISFRKTNFALPRIRLLRLFARAPEFFAYSLS